MNESFSLDLTNLLITKLMDIGLQLIFPFLIVVCLVVSSVKLKQLAITTQQPALRYVSYGLLNYALSFIVPFLMMPVIFFVAGDSADEGYMDLTVSAAGFTFALIGTFFLFKATLKFSKEE
jgi:hypothetical protein